MWYILLLWNIFNKPRCKYVTNSSRPIFFVCFFKDYSNISKYKKLCLFCKTIKNQSPKYFSELILTARQTYMKRHKNSVPLFKVKHDYFKNSLFPLTVIEWNKLDSNIRNSESLALFKKRILTFEKIFRK